MPRWGWAKPDRCDGKTESSRDDVVDGERDRGSSGYKGRQS